MNSSRSFDRMIGGSGSYGMGFSHYDSRAAKVQQEIIAKSKMKEDEEE